MSDGTHCRRPHFLHPVSPGNGPGRICRQHGRFSVIDGRRGMTEEIQIRPRAETFRDAVHQPPHPSLDLISDLRPIPARRSLHHRVRHHRSTGACRRTGSVHGDLSGGRRPGARRGRPRGDAQRPAAHRVARRTGAGVRCGSKSSHREKCTDRNWPCGLHRVGDRQQAVRAIRYACQRRLHPHRKSARHQVEQHLDRRPGRRLPA